MLTEILVGIAALVGYIYWRFVQKTKYWEKQGVKTAGGISFPMGNTAFVHSDVIRGKKNVNVVVLEQYKEFKDEPCFGTYGPMGEPILVINDLELIKTVMVKDFANFVDRNNILRFSGTAKSDIYWAKQLTSLRGAEWKDARAVFTPIFTTGKMKMMTEFIEMVATQLDKEVSKSVKEGKPVELRGLLGKFSMDTIAACAYGVDAQSFTNSESKFVKHARSVFRRSPKDMIASLAIVIPAFEKLSTLLNIPLFKSEETTFLADSLKETLKQRQNGKIRRNDLIDLMLDAIKKSEATDGMDKTKFDETLVIATAMIVLVAGYDTTAITMSYVVYQLAMNPDIQKRVQEEADEACKAAGNKMPDYTKIQELEYLDMVIHEALRLYSPAGFVTRAVTKDYKLPGHEVVMPAGSEVHIPIFGIHRDPRYYETPDVFNPEHFSKEAKGARDPYAFLGFGQGPRNCIGMRFALLEAKMGIVSIVSKYNVSKCAETPLTTTFDPESNLANCLEPLLVNMEKRTDPSMH